MAFVILIVIEACFRHLIVIDNIQFRILNLNILQAVAPVEPGDGDFIIFL